MIENILDKEIKKEVDALFDKYEKDETKHLKVFHSTCEDYNHYNLHSFKIIRRLTLDEVSADDMPMWKIEFNDGKQIDAFVDEIFKL